MRRIALLIFCVLIALGGGCESAQSFVNAAMPSLGFQSVRVTDLTMEGIDLAFDVEVDNPNPIKMPLADLDYELVAGGTRLAAGRVNVKGSIPARSSREITVPTTLRFDDLLTMLENVPAGTMVPFTFQGTVATDELPGLGDVQLPVQIDGELPIPAIPQVSVVSLEWDELSLMKAQARLTLDIVNTNQFTFELDQLAYAFELGGVTVADTKLRETARFAESASRTIELPLTIRPVKLGMAAFQMMHGNSASYRLSGQMNVETPYGPLLMPFDSAGSTPLVR